MEQNILVPVDRLVLVSMAQELNGFLDYGVKLDGEFPEDFVVPRSVVYEIGLLSNDGERFKPIRLLASGEVFAIAEERFVPIENGKIYFLQANNNVGERSFTKEEMKNGITLENLHKLNKEILMLQMNNNPILEEVKKTNYRRYIESSWQKDYKGYHEYKPTYKYWETAKFLPEDLILVSVPEYKNRLQNYMLDNENFTYLTFRRGGIVPKGQVFEYAIINKDKTRCKLVRGFFTEQHVYDLKDVQVAKVWPNGYIETKNKVIIEGYLRGWYDYRIAPCYPNGVGFSALNKTNVHLVKRFMSDNYTIYRQVVSKRELLNSQKKAMERRKEQSEKYNNF